MMIVFSSDNHRVSRYIMTSESSLFHPEKTNEIGNQAHTSFSSCSLYFIVRFYLNESSGVFSSYLISIESTRITTTKFYFSCEKLKDFSIIRALIESIFFGVVCQITNIHSHTNSLFTCTNAHTNSYEKTRRLPYIYVYVYNTIVSRKKSKK